jgi:hypothetical protein
MHILENIAFYHDFYMLMLIYDVYQSHKTHITRHFAALSYVLMRSPETFDFLLMHTHLHSS